MASLLEIIDTYEAGADRLQQAVTGIEGEQWHATPGPGAWSIHEVIIHLADSDGVSIERMKRIAAMEQPALLDYDETAFIRSLHPDTQSVEDAMLLFRVNRRQWSRVLRKLDSAVFDRVGFHSVSGKVSLREMLPRYIDHLEGHIAFIQKKRERMGLPIT